MLWELNHQQPCKLKSKDVAAIEEFAERLRAALWNNLVELKLFGSKATGKHQPEQVEQLG
jgi:hypothetical protein